jgi:hypothetical protein
MLNQYLKELRKTEDIDNVPDISEKKTDPDCRCSCKKSNDVAN